MLSLFIVVLKLLSWKSLEYSEILTEENQNFDSCWVSNLFHKDYKYVKITNIWCENVILYMGSSTLLLFIFWGALPKIEKNVKICLNTFSRNYLCQKIVKGGWQSWIFRDPLNSTKFGCFTKITCRSPIVKVRYKCYTFSETSGQPLKGGEERKVKNGQEN